jgi:carbon monoxide dehydrogenase subunit G
VRRKNFPQPSGSPFATAAGLSSTSGTYQGSLGKLLQLIGDRQLREEQHRLRHPGKFIGAVFIVGVAARATLEDNGGTCQTSRVGITGVAAQAFRARPLRPARLGRLSLGSGTSIYETSAAACIDAGAGRGTVKVSGSYTVNAPRERLWKALNDPAFLKTCLPGCESLEASGPDQYQATLTVGIAAVKGKYTGSVTLSEKEPPQRFKMQVDGKGTGGFMQGAGLLEFADDPQGTKVTYQGDVQVGGPIASIGQRLLDGAAKMIVGHFFTAVNTQLAGMSAPPTPPPTS